MNIKKINTASLRSAESFVEQDTVLFHDSIEENLRIANQNATHEQVVGACKKASIHDFIMTLPPGLRYAGRGAGQYPFGRRAPAFWAWHGLFARCAVYPAG